MKDWQQANKTINKRLNFYYEECQIFKKKMVRRLKKKIKRPKKSLNQNDLNNQ